MINKFEQTRLYIKNLEKKNTVNADLLESIRVLIDDAVEGPKLDEYDNRGEGGILHHPNPDYIHAKIIIARNLIRGEGHHEDIR